MIVVDAMNVIGSVPDGWWRDRGGALERLVDALVAHRFDEQVVVVADGHPVAGLAAGSHGEVELRYSGSRARDSADDHIVAFLDESGAAGVTVVTSDAALAARVRALGASVDGARSFRRRVGW